MLKVSIGVGAAEGASLLRRGTSWYGRPPKIILARIGFSLGQPAHCAQGAILSPHYLCTLGVSVNNGRLDVG